MAVTSLMIANLTTTSTYVDSFIVEVYSDSGLTTLVGSGSCSAANDSSGNSVQQEPITINNLSWGTTYYARAGVKADVSGLVVWSSTETVAMGTATAPSAVTYSATITPTTSGVNATVTPASVPTDIQRFDAIWNITGTTPLSTDSPSFSGVQDASGKLSFFAGGTPGSTVYVWMRAVNTSGLTQTWTALGNAVALNPATAVQQSSFTYSADTGTANAYAVTLTPTPTVVAGSVITFQAAHANTGASTLSVNGGSATPIKKSGNIALSAGDIAAGQIIAVVYDATDNVWQTQGAVTPSGSTNLVYATPNGSSGGASLRPLVGADLPIMGASGSSHSPGAVPDPGGTLGSTRFLREDGTWSAPSGSGVTSLNSMSGSLAIAPGFGTNVSISGSNINIVANTHSESLTDGNGNFIFAATLTMSGDIITVVGVPN